MSGRRMIEPGLNGTVEGTTTSVGLFMSQANQDSSRNASDSSVKQSEDAEEEKAFVEKYF